MMKQSTKKWFLVSPLNGIEATIAIARTAVVEMQSKINDIIHLWADWRGNNGPGMLATDMASSTVANMPSIVASSGKP